MQGNWVCPWVRKIPWNRKWQTTPVFFPGEFHGQRSQAGYSPWGHKESDMIEWLTYTVWHQIINCSEPRGKGNIGCKYTYDNKILCDFYLNVIFSPIWLFHWVASSDSNMYSNLRPCLSLRKESHLQEEALPLQVEIIDWTGIMWFPFKECSSPWHFGSNSNDLSYFMLH